jgi:hypothetical protein
MRGYALHWAVDSELVSKALTLLCLDKGVFILGFFET